MLRKPMSTQTTQTALSFAELGVPASIVDALVAEGRPTPFPIQESTLPSTLAGADVLGRGRTGSGKTLAFAIPLVARIGALRAGDKRRGRRPAGLVLSPTRELATQIAATIEPLAKAEGLKVTTIFGGVSQKRQEDALRDGVDIVVACPGRLEDLMKQGYAHLDQVTISVLDEADHMADLGFLPGVTRIMAATAPNAQRLLFSATLDNGVDKIVKRFLRNPIEHTVDEANAPVVDMTHHLFAIEDQDAKNEIVKALASGSTRRVFFMRTKHQAKKLAKQLTAAGIPAVDLHGNLSQAARDRNLAAFSSGEVRVLVATDVAARGVHVDDVDLVVHVDPPAEHKAYLHRSGRTARAGNSGDVVTLMLEAQRKDTLDLLKKAKIQVTPQRVTATSAPVTALVGEVAPRVTPRAGGPGVGNRPLETAPTGKSQGANAQRKRQAREQRAGGGTSSRPPRARREGGARDDSRDAEPAQQRRQRSGGAPRQESQRYRADGRSAGDSSRNGEAPRRDGARAGDAPRRGEGARHGDAARTHAGAARQNSAQRNHSENPRHGSAGSHASARPAAQRRRAGRPSGAPSGR